MLTGFDIFLIDVIFQVSIIDINHLQYLLFRVHTTDFNHSLL